jgi:hypothetical protein
MRGIAGLKKTHDEFLNSSHQNLREEVSNLGLPLLAVGFLHFKLHLNSLFIISQRYQWYGTA